MKVWNYKSNSDDKLAQQLSKDNSIVYTKPEMAKYLLSLIEFKEWDVVMEPCKWLWAFYDNFPNFVNKEFCELNEWLDYLEYKWIVDITISNPPFVPRKLFWDFQKKAMTTTKREIWWLINMWSLNVFTPKRLDEMRDNWWFIEQINITWDKRWFWRYCFIKIWKQNKWFFKWNNLIF